MLLLIHNMTEHRLGLFCKQCESVVEISRRITKIRKTDYGQHTPREEIIKKFDQSHPECLKPLLCRCRIIL